MNDKNQDTMSQVHDLIQGIKNKTPNDIDAVIDQLKSLSKNLGSEEVAILDTIIKNIESIKEKIIEKEHNTQLAVSAAQELSDIEQQKLAEEKKIRDENDAIFKHAIILNNEWEKERPAFKTATDEDIDLIKKANESYNAATGKFEGLTDREEAKLTGQYPGTAEGIKWQQEDKKHSQRKKERSTKLSKTQSALTESKKKFISEGESIDSKLQSPNLDNKSKHDLLSRKNNLILHVNECDKSLENNQQDVHLIHEEFNAIRNINSKDKKIKKIKLFFEENADLYIDQKDSPKSKELFALLESHGYEVDFNARELVKSTKQTKDKEVESQNTDKYVSEAKTTLTKDKSGNTNISANQDIKNDESSLSKAVKKDDAANKINDHQQKENKKSTDLGQDKSYDSTSNTKSTSLSSYINNKNEVKDKMRPKDYNNALKILKTVNPPIIANEDQVVTTPVKPSPTPAVGKGQSQSKNNTGKKSLNGDDKHHGR